MSLLLLAGCKPPAGANGAASKGANDEIPRASVTLQVAVVNDPSLREAIDRLRGEWASLTDGEVKTILINRDSIAKAASENDLIVFPSRLLGELCEAGQLRPVRGNVLRMDTLQLDDLLPAVRDQEIIYGRRVMALPLGCPAPLWLRPEEIDSIDPPDEDLRLALAYLAWAAPHVVHRSREAALFDLDNFSPRLTEPPFVRALDRFVEVCELETEIRGQIVWPYRAGYGPASEGSMIVSPLPGAKEAYNPLADAWESLGAEPSQATLIASSGRLIGVTQTSRNAATAFRLAAWLAGRENAAAICVASDGVANCRGSLARKGDKWLGKGSSDMPTDLDRQFAMAQAESLRSRRVLITPRLPGADRYLQALGAAIRRRLDGELTTTEALGAAAAAWESISSELGSSEQKQAYLHSVNAAELEISR